MIEQTKKQSTKIEKSDNLGDVAFKYPEVAEVLLDYGLHCVHCVAAGYDTFEMGAKIHGMSDEEIDEMMVRVNEAVEFGE